MPYISHLEAAAKLDENEWVATEGGKNFVGRSSDEWRRASIAAGTPEAAAREAAGRTTAFYTGQN